MKTHSPTILAALAATLALPLLPAPAAAQAFAQENGRPPGLRSAELLPVATLPDGRRIVGSVPGVFGHRLVRVSYSRLKATARARALFDEVERSFQGLARVVERAQALLRIGELSVTDVCMAVGCTSLGSFSAKFTELVGQTPSDYRAASHDGLVGVPGCIANQMTRPRR